jgi:transposase
MGTCARMGAHRVAGRIRAALSAGRTVVAGLDGLRRADATAAWKQFKTQVPEWMVSQLQHCQEEALGIDAKERQVRQQLEKMVSIILPIGVGALSRITLEMEIRGWDRFENRRQTASYTGLCPGIHNSNGRGLEGSINRCGNSAVRYTLIEMVWRMLCDQPDSPIKRLRSMVSKRRLVVAAARRLADRPVALGHRSC